MIEIAFSSSFKRAFKKRIQGNPRLEAHFWEKVSIFQNNAFDPRIKTHKLSGQLEDLWSFSIEYDLRVVFSFVNNQQALFIDIGPHREVY